MILILIFILGCITLLICYEIIKHYYLQDKYENLITKKFNSISYKVLSIKTVERPHFITESEIQGLGFVNPLPIIITYRFVELENFQSEKYSAYISIERILYTKLTLRYFLNVKGNDNYKELI